jgi:hypothetical protein
MKWVRADESNGWDWVHYNGIVPKQGHGWEGRSIKSQAAAGANVADAKDDSKDVQR